MAKVSRVLVDAVFILLILSPFLYLFAPWLMMSFSSLGPSSEDKALAREHGCLMDTVVGDDESLTCTDISGCVIHVPKQGDGTVVLWCPGTTGHVVRKDGADAGGRHD